MTPNAFIHMVAPAAMDFMRKHGIVASLTIAEGALESYWGQSAPGNNLFGIKWTPGCRFPYVEVPTKEYIDDKPVIINAKFRKYASFAESIADHGNFLVDNSRYANLRGVDYKTACDLIRRDGYATDPQYSKSLREIIEQYHLYDYDKEVIRTSQPTWEDLIDRNKGWSGFTDDVKWAYENGILGHYSNNTIQRGGVMSREQFAYAIHQVVKKLQAGQLKG